MNQEIKQEWIAALRSGKYKQTKYRLRKSDSWCCLGVLCDIVDPHNWTPSLISSFDPVYTHNGRKTTPAGSVLEKTGINSQQTGTLVILNDQEGANFEKIADYIEACF